MDTSLEMNTEQLLPSQTHYWEQQATLPISKNAVLQAPKFTETVHSDGRLQEKQNQFVCTSFWIALN